MKILVVHPTGHPDNAWSIPKGEPNEGETPKAAALREFEEETGIPIPEVADDMFQIGEYKYMSGKKRLLAFACIQTKPWTKRMGCSTTFVSQYGKNKGETVPECDDFKWMPIAEAEKVLHPTQRQALTNLMEGLHRTY